MRLTSAGRAARRFTGAALAATMIPAVLLGGSSSAAPEFGAPTKFGARGFEIGINVMPDGTVFVDEPAGLGAHSNLWRSDNGGQNFSKLVFTSPYHRMPGGGDSDVAVTADGRVYFLDLWLGSNSISVSEDKGATWTRGTPFTSLPLSDRQWIAVGSRDPETGLDTVYVIYKHLTVPMLVHTTMFARSRDGGLTWDFHTAVPSITSSSGGSTGKLVADGDFLAFTFTASGERRIATSTDAGTTWTTTKISQFQDADGNIAGTALADDHLYAAWVDRQNNGVKFAASTDQGATWSFPEEIGAGGTIIYSWVAARDDKVAAVWYETDSVGSPDTMPPTTQWKLMYAESLNNGTTWSTPVPVSGVVKRGAICTQGLNCNSGRETGDFVTLTIMPSGQSIIAYYDAVKDGSDPSGSAGVVTKQAP